MSGLLAALRQPAALAAVTGLPVQEWAGGADGRDHYASDGETRANGGAGRAPGRGKGVVDPALPEQPAPKAWTAPKASGADSFDPATSKRSPKTSGSRFDEFKNADGSITRRVHQARVNYQAEDGSYRPIDTGLTRRGDRLEMGANSIDVTLGARGSDDTAAPAPSTSASPSAAPSASPSVSATPAGERVEAADEALAEVTTASGHTMAYDLAGAADVAAVVDGSTATYPEILPGTDLELRTFSDGLKETIVLKSPAAGHEWVFPLKLEGLTAREQPDGTLVLVDADGAVVMRVPAGYMEDSKVDPKSGAPAQSSGVKYDLITVDGGQALKVTADEAWLNDPARQYPVRIDPTAWTTLDTGDVFVDNSNDTTNHNGDNLPVGTWNGGTTISRSFIHFDNFGKDLGGSQIKSAKLFLWHTWSYNCTDFDPVYIRRITEAWTVASMTDNGKLAAGPSYSAPIGTMTIGNNKPACENTGADRGKGAWRSVGLNAATFNAWSTGAMPNYGLALTASESDSSAFKRFTSANYSSTTDPYLDLTYDNNEYPQVNEQYPGYGQPVQTLTPELLADAHDPDNWPKSLTYEFIVYGKDAKTQIATSKAITKKSWRVPANVLKWGESYYWTVKVSDGLLNNSEYLSKHLLVTPVPQPSITSGLSQNSDQGFDPVGGNYTTSARDAVVTTVGPDVEVVRSYNSIDPRVSQGFGAGWSSVVDTKAVEKYTVAPDGTTVVHSVVVTYPNGRELAFGRNYDLTPDRLDDTYSSPAGRASTFTAIGTDGYKLVEKDGTTYEFGQEVQPGRLALTALKDGAGRAATFTYTDNLLTKVRSASGRNLNFVWTSTAPRHVAAVATDPVTPGDWDSANTWSYEYTGNSLTKVCPPTNWQDCHRYEYTTGSLYQTAVTNSRPHSYWRLMESSGTKAGSSMLENAGADNGVYSNVTLGQAGPLSGSTATAAGFNGTSSQVALPANLDGDAANQAVSMWFKTAGGDGVLYGQSWDNSASATAKGAYNPTLYIGSDGKLVGGFPKTPALGTAIGSLIASGQGQCLTVPGNSSANGVRIALANCAGTANQQWTWTAARELRVTTGGVVKCMDAEDAGVANGVDVITWPCNGQTNQKWDVQADGQIINDGAGLCLDSVGTGLATELGAEMQIWACGKQRKADQSFLSRAHSPMQTAASVADNQWHHVVLSTTGDKQQMYLDGALKAEQTGITVQDMSPAFSYVGVGFLGGAWPNQSHANANSNLGTRDYFTGSVAEVAYFDTPVDKTIVDDLWAARVPVKPLTQVIRPSARANAVVGYDGATGRVSQVTDGNGSVWKPEPPQPAGTTKVYESAVLGGAPTNYWRMAESGVTDAVNEVNGGTATYSSVTLGSVAGPFGANHKAASFNGEDSYVDLPPGVAPSGNSSVSLWFNTTSTNQALVGKDRSLASIVQPGAATLWITEDGKLRGLSPSSTPTGPLGSGIAGKCADVQGGATDNGTPIQLYTCNGTASQNWTAYSDGSIRAFNKCLDVSNAGTANGTKIQLWGCNNGVAQQWEPYGAGGLRNPNSEKCLDDPGSSKTDGTDLQLYTCNFSAAQEWNLSLASKTAVNDGKWHHAALTTNGTSQTLYLDGAKVQSASGSVAMAPNSAVGYQLGNTNVGLTDWSNLIGAAGYFKGSLAEAAFYASELDANQVLYQFKARAAATSAPSGEITYAITGPGNAQTKAVHDLMYGRKVADIDALNNATRYGYSGKGNLRTVTDPLGNMIINEHDVRGNVVAVTTCQDRSENNCSTNYSSFYPDATTENPPPHVHNDRLIAERGPGSASATDPTYLTTYTYDALGNRTTMVDPLKRKTTIAYTDGSGTGGYQNATAPAGLPWRIVKPGGGTQTILYYASGDVAQTTDPAGAVTRYEYDALGRTTKEIDVVDGVAGATTTFTHDRLDRVVTVTDAASTNVISGAVHTPVTTLSYNVDGLLTAEAVSDTTGGDAPRTVTYGYDNFGRRVTETDELDNTVTLGYDAYGRVDRQTHADGSTVRTKFDAVGNELETIVEGYTGDPNAPTAAADVAVRSMEYDKAGRLASETDAMGWVNAYTYTDNNLLVSVTRKNPKTGESFVMERNAYDAAGNVISQVTNNGLTKTTRGYDAAGRNLTATLDPSGALNRTTTYGYSIEDEVVSTTLAQGSTVLGSSETTYDRLGRARQQTTYLSTGLTPTARWKLDETAGTAVADSAGNNTGTVSGAVTWSTERGGAAAFTGGTAAITGQPAVDTMRPYTLGAWARLATKDADRVVAAMSGDIGDSAVKLQYDKETDGWQVALAVRNQDGTTSWLTSPATAPAVVNRWTHLAVTVDPATRTAKLYVDGTVAATVTTTNDLNNRATDLRVGADTATSGFFSGLIDDVQAYQKVLSADEIGQLVSGAAPSPGARVIRTTYGLDKDGSVTSVTDPKGATTFVTNDEVGRAALTASPAVSTVVGEGNPVTAVATSRVGYNTFGEVTEQQDPNGNITVARYDGVGQMVQTESPAYTAPGASEPIKAKSTVVYNAVGQVESSTDPLGATTSFVYDQLGRTAKVTAPDSGVSRYRYDPNGELLSYIDPTGAKVESTFDYLGRTLTSTQAVRQAATSYQTTYDYGTSPWPTAVTSPTGVVTRIGYNGAGEQTTVTDGAGKTTTTQYDGAGRPTRVTSPDSTYSTVTYDLAGRTLSTAEYSAAGAQLRTRSQEYDAAGNTASSTDALGTRKTFDYDALGQLISQREPISDSDAIVTRFGYDVAGQRTRVTDESGTKTITTYNPWGLVASQIEPATAATPNLADRTYTMSYDAAGRPTRADSPGGVRVTSEYDVMGRLKTSAGEGAQVTTQARRYEYDLAGRMTSLTGSAGSTTMQYDDRGLVTTIGGVSGASSYEYDGSGALTRRIDAAGTTAYGYDSAGRLSTLSNANAGLSQSYQYNDLSAVKSITFAGGNVRSFGYNDLHQLVTDEVKTAAGASVAKIAYGFDRNDNMTAKTTTGFNGASSNTYKYDLAGRLVNWDNGTTPVVYAYDKAGNRVQAGTKSFVYDQRNRLVSSSDGTTYQYTARGTLSATISGGQQTNTVTDAFNQVVSQGAKNGSVSQYTYDGLGRLVRPGLTYTGLGNTVAADAGATYVYDTADGLAGVGSGGTGRYAWTNNHMDVVGEFSGNGTALTGSVSYDPWGKVLASGGMAGKLGYQSEWTDQGTGKVNMWARWYDPETGAFDTRDTATLDATPSSGAANRFAYAEADPLSNTDTTGNAVDGRCGEYDHACAMRKYQGEMAQYNRAMDQRDRDMKAAGSDIAQQEAEHQRAERESQTPLLDILLQVGIGMLLDMIGYTSLVGCLGGSIWDCVDLASNFLGPIKAIKMARSLFRAADRAFAGYRMWKRIVEGARTVIRRTQDLINLARKHLSDLMQKVPKKPKVPKKKPKPPVKKKPKPKPKPQPKPKPSKPATKPKPQAKPKKDPKPEQTKPRHKQQKQQERSQKRDRDQDRDEDERPEPQGCDTGVHSFDPVTRVVMADGTTRPISEVNVGDEVLAKDPGTGAKSARAVTLLHANRDVDLTDVTVSERPADAADRSVGEGEGGRSTRGPTASVLHTTTHHPFWDATTGEWVNAADLVPGKSTLVGPDGQIQYVTGVRELAGPKVMRDLTVADIHTYYVIAGNAPVLVHNNDPGFINLGVAGDSCPNAASAADWVDEGGFQNSTPPAPSTRSGWFRFQSAGAGSRSNVQTGRAQVPQYSAPDGNGGIVTAKFDSAFGNEAIDRKLGLTGFGRDEAERQVAVARHHGLQAIYELPSQIKVDQANVLLGKWGVTGIKTRVGSW